MLNITPEQQTNRGLEELSRLRRFTGSPAEFWPAFISAASTVAGAEKGILILKDPKENNWKKLSESAATAHGERVVLTFTRQLVEIGQRSAENGSALFPIEETAHADFKHYAMGVKLPLSKPEEICIATFLLRNATEQQANEALVRVQLSADTPFAYLLNLSTTQARGESDKFAASIDVITLLNAEKKFLGAAIALCNAVETRYNCDRVSLGWLERGYIRMKSISRTERFDKNMAAVKAMEMMMEECLDQDEEIVVPAPEKATFVCRDHEKFSKQNSAVNICSIPIRVDGKPLAVLTCERQARPFTAAELQQLRLAGDQAARRLSDLHEREGWFGARLTRTARVQCAKVLGPEHTWAKVAAIAGTMALFVLFFIPFNYRVQGNFILKSDAVSYLTAPFDCFIKEVPVRPGDRVRKDAVLLQMNTDELAIEEANALADQVRFQREAEKARATNGLAEMRIALALVDQAKARLDMTRLRLQQSTIRATFDSVIVEGDLRERIGAPVKQGDALFKTTKLDGMYVEGEINQRDVQNVKLNAAGEIAFVTQPKLKYRVLVERVYPAAVTKEAENLFISRLIIQDPPANWWRPGMSGLVKVEAGKRTLFWILTHRTVDFLRLWLWW
jgi:multidrug resistance efflux pump